MFRFVFSFVLCLICLTVFGQPMGRDYWIDRYLSVCYPLKHIKVNSSFGSRKDPFTGEKTFHSGLDLQADYEEVYSMFNGQVKKIGSDNRSGRYVTLQHGEYTGVAAALGVYIHGKCGERASEKYSEASATAGNILEFIHEFL